MSSELVSVIIPTFNRASVEAAIESALGQTHDLLEVIVVDDGSTDDTRARIAGRYGSDSRVRYLHQENRGVAAARNAGLAVARGDYIALLDSDDLWYPWKLEVQLCVLRELPEAGMVWTDMEAVGPDGELVSRAYLRTMYSTYKWFPGETLFRESRNLAEICPGSGTVASNARVYWGDIFSAMIMGNLVHTSTVLLRRARLMRVRGFNEALRVSGEDYDFHLRTCREGPVAFVGVPSIRYQIGRNDQLASKKNAIHMARNFLATITPVLENDRDRIDLPPGMIADVQAWAHQWLGTEHERAGEFMQARQHFWESLRHRPFRPKVWALLGLATLPPAVCTASLAALRRIKSHLTSLPQL